MSHAFYAMRIDSIKQAIKETEATLEGLHNDLHLYEAAAKVENLKKIPTENTKLVWVSDTNPESYSVAVGRYGGVLEVKRVMDGQGLCHNTAQCECNPCSEINLSARLGVPMPPWLKGAPLVKSFYKSIGEWISTLPVHGNLTITEPRPSCNLLRSLRNLPLKETTDAGKLKELEARFPGATMTLLMNGESYIIKFITDAEKNPEYNMIHCASLNLVTPSFARFDVYGKFNLVAKWRGVDINLTHLF